MLGGLCCHLSNPPVKVFPQFAITVLIYLAIGWVHQHVPSQAPECRMSTMKQLIRGSPRSLSLSRNHWQGNMHWRHFLLLVSMVSSGAALQLDLQHVKLVKYSSLNERKMFHAQKWMQTLNPFPCAPLSPIPNCWMYSWSSEHIFVYWVTVFCCWNIAVVKYFNVHVEV